MLRNFRFFVHPCLLRKHQGLLFIFLAHKSPIFQDLLKLNYVHELSNSSFNFS